MTQKITHFQKTWIILILLLCSNAVHAATRQMEYLNRGVVAVKTTDGVYLSWRFLGTDNTTTAFNIYRDGTLLNKEPITESTNYTDKGGTASSTYIIKSVTNNVETESSEPTTVWDRQYRSIQLKRPSGGSNASGSYTYTPNDISAGDVDGDGEYELIVKWDPSNSQDNSKSGYTGNVYLDGYKLDGTFLWRIDLGVNIRAGAHYTQFQVYDYDGDGKAEVACKTAPGTKDGKGKYVLMGSDDPYKDYRNSSGYILNGPEYLTIFSGETGEELSTVAYNPLRGSITKANWGDTYGNRVDRFLACTAYLDGVHPSLVMCRGYYTQSNLVAYDFKDGRLTQRWEYHSGTSDVGAYGEGFHNLSVADVDNDGFDEIIYGSACIDHNGSLYYRTGFGHGDAMHVSQMVPGTADLEGWFVHEETGSAYGFELRNLRTGKVIFGEKTGTDVGRGLAADIDAAHPGFECWSTGSNNVYDCTGKVISTSRPSVNFRIYWDGDLQDELLDGTKLDKWNGNGVSRLYTLYNESEGYGTSCNSTKATPCLQADLLGDWREEIILYNGNDPSKINLYTTTIPTQHRLFTPMHDAVYRMGVAWQNSAYNQPPHLGIYIGDGVGNVTQPDIYVIKNGTTIAGEPTLTKQGAGSSFQSTENKAAIVDFNYAWTNAASVKVEWTPLPPTGINVTIDNAAQKVYFSGTPTSIGTFSFTVTTISGSETEASKSGTIQVTDPANTSKLEYEGELTQTIFEGNAIEALTFSWGNGTTGIEIDELPAGILSKQEANSTTISGTPNQSFTTKVTSIGKGETITYEINVTVIPSGIKKVAYITDATASNYANDTKILPALKNCQDLYVVEIDAQQSNVDLSFFDLIVVCEVAGSTSPIMAELKGIDKPMLNMKVHVYKNNEATWNWATNGFGDNTQANTLTISADMLTHPMFKDIEFNNGNEIQMLSSVTNKGYTYMNPESFASVTGNITSIATIKDAEQVCIFEAPAGTVISGTKLEEPFIQIGLNSSSLANITADGVSIVLNACYYLLGMNSDETDYNDQAAISEMAVYPNPIRDFINMETEATKEGVIEIRIFDTNGKLMMFRSEMTQQGRNRYVINRGSITSGDYLLEVKDEEKTLRKKIIMR